jgi:hypothetical protein
MIKRAPLFLLVACLPAHAATISVGLSATTDPGFPAEWKRDAAGAVALAAKVSNLGDDPTGPAIVAALTVLEDQSGESDPSVVNVFWKDTDNLAGGVAITCADIINCATIGDKVAQAIGGNRSVSQARAVDGACVVRLKAPDKPGLTVRVRCP